MKKLLLGVLIMLNLVTIVHAETMIIDASDVVGASERSTYEKVSKYGNLVLEPISVVTNTANELIQPGMELLYEPSTTEVKYESTGPKFKLTF